jgi:D-alanyl-D-alanine carboxypeptidase/D-alanyl-D-alanine-endopeptidase (penicillin-binding protein 4)
MLTRLRLLTRRADPGATRHAHDQEVHGTALLAPVCMAIGLALMPAADAAPKSRPAFNGATLPPQVAAALRVAQVPERDVAIVVQPLADDGLTLALNARAPMNPASTMKLVTTYAGLQFLGPAYTWRTEVFATGALRADVLEGALTLRGGGDPKLVIENLWLLVHRIRGYGVRELRGDIVLDKSAFELSSGNGNAFDANELRPYNAGPDALLVNFKAITFGFVPDFETRTARVVVTPQLAGMQAPAAVRLTEGPCGDWRGRLLGDFSDAMKPLFRGAYPASCGERLWPVSVLSHHAYFEAAFRSLWEAAGGTWIGRVRDGTVPSDARRIAVHESEPLAQVIRDINKHSNNVMARQLLLTISTETGGRPGTIARGAAAIKSGLASRGLDLPELVIENGAGLSRLERVSADGLARLLRHAYASPWMPEFMSSLPIVGLDGTMKNRNGAAGSAHIKTGLLADVRAVAGYVLAASGKRYVVVALINHPNAGAAQPAHDALLEWVYRNG